MTLILYLPFALLVIAANYAEKHEWLKRWLTVLLFVLNLVVLLAAAGSVLLSTQAVVDQGTITGGDAGGTVGLSYLVASVVALVLLVPAARRGLSRIINISPDSSVHLLALTTAVYFLAISAPWGWRGLGAGASLPLAGPLSSWDLALGSIMMVLLAIAGVGLVTRRSWSQTLARLKLHPLTSRQIGGCALVIVGLLALDRTVVWLWAVYLPENFELVQSLNTQLLSGLMTPLGAIVIAVASGLGEESLFRGALQPRFGIVLTSVLFALAHVQYALSPALVEILVISVVLGLLRRRFNLTACILVHAGYNFVDVLIMAMGSGL